MVCLNKNNAANNPLNDPPDFGMTFGEIPRVHAEIMHQFNTLPHVVLHVL